MFIARPLRHSVFLLLLLPSAMLKQGQMLADAAEA